MEKSVINLFTDDVLRRSARLFGIEPQSLTLISDVENFVYSGQARETPLILRITHTSHRTMDLLMGELDWIDHLRSNGLSVTQPVQSINGKWIETVETSHTRFLVTTFHKLAGVNMIDGNLCTPELYRKWGETLGKMHRLAKGYAPHDISSKRLEWFQNEFVQDAEKYIHGQASILEKYRQLVAALHALPRDENSYGLIHTDLTDVNFFVHDQNILVYDFDDCEYHWFIYDIAVILFENLEWLPQQGMEKEQFAGFFFHHFMEGYEKVNHLNDFWIRQLPYFFRLRELFLYTVYHKKWDLENLTERRANFLKRLRDDIENDIPYLNFEGLLD